VDLVKKRACQVRSGNAYTDEAYFQTHGPVMRFDGSDGSEIEASNVAGSNRPVCVALGVADGREWISILKYVYRIIEMGA
jgi:hypothetical protein